MKTKTLILATAIAACLAGSALAADVTVTLTGVQDRGGNMLVSLQSRDQFMKPMGAAGAMGPAAAGTMTLVVHDVEPGDYAVLVMHDEDGNWTLTRKDGRPAEGLASSGRGPVTHATTFDDVKISVPAGGVAMTLPVTYP